MDITPNGQLIIEEDTIIYASNDSNDYPTLGVSRQNKKKNELFFSVRGDDKLHVGYSKSDNS